MSEELSGANAHNENAQFENIGDENYFESTSAPDDGTGDQLYLDSVIPQSIFEIGGVDSTALNPRRHDGEDEFGFMPVPKNPYEYAYTNMNKYYFPEHKEQVF